MKLTTTSKFKKKFLASQENIERDHPELKRTLSSNIYEVLSDYSIILAGNKATI